IVISGLPKYSPDMANDYLWYAKEGPLQDFGIRYPDTAVRVGDQQILVNYVIGYVLPSTGGVGTVPYRVAGALLAILSLLALMERRRHNH
ncbi:MAG: LPXTG cell wall anchor domain-containing protein, partial [Clostridia bacterium]|nr:LPXTG cell wall anchor domain-containing protein [Clostridia bacterium]